MFDKVLFWFHCIIIRLTTYFFPENSEEIVLVSCISWNSKSIYSVFLLDYLELDSDNGKKYSKFHMTYCLSLFPKSILIPLKEIQGVLLKCSA